jgi:hypothetical protein
MEKVFGISYPTVKNRLNRIAQQLRLVEVEEVSDHDEVFDLLERGEITVRKRREVGAMRCPPYAVSLRIEEADRTKVRLWLPVFILWPLLTACCWWR